MMRPQPAGAPLDDDLTILWDPNQNAGAVGQVAAPDEARPALPTSLARSPLVGAAAPLLHALIAFRRIAPIKDISALRHGLVAAMHAFEENALQAGAHADDVLAARYLLCCALDESISTTSWAGESDWSRNSLLVTFHNETWGGDKAFALIERVRQDPARYNDLLQLAFYILALGFEGKYRVVSNGLLQLEELRADIARQVQIQPAAVGGRPALQAEPIRRRRREGFYVPVWVSVVSAVILLLGMFLWFETNLIEEMNPLVSLLKRADGVDAPLNGFAAASSAPALPQPGSAP
jgi:type VI secretion system protein ImpK